MRVSARANLIFAPGRAARDTQVDPKGLEARHKRLADPAEPDHEHVAAEQLAAERLAKPSGLDGLDTGGQLAQQRQRQQYGVLGAGRRVASVGARDVAHVDASPAGLVDVDALEPDACALCPRCRGQPSM